ncbi:ABC-2 type transport system ATP-binding protein [Enterococcus sp. AZ194]|uniref:ABC transporter ATP-binding protein n=1 Tax=Enterococcus sp. AZ194 TaxID=2774629 RepID=UPI003F277A44
MEISVEEVSKVIKQTPILTNISLSFESGRIYGLRGKNGAGKTMLLRLLCGLIFPTNGRIMIDKKELGKDFSFPESVGILIENPGFIQSYSGFKNLKNLASIKNEIEDQVIMDLMTYFDLDWRDKKKVKHYSLGMKQKIGIISALMESPKLILLDEPINALDEESSKKVLDLLTLRKNEGALIIVASHDKEELDFLSDEIIEMKAGKIITQQNEGKHNANKN